jgi:hypothetical protein
MILRLLAHKKGYAHKKHYKAFVKFTKGMDKIKEANT